MSRDSASPKYYHHQGNFQIVCGGRRYSRFTYFIPSQVSPLSLDSLSLSPLLHFLLPLITSSEENEEKEEAEEEEVRRLEIS